MSFTYEFKDEGKHCYDGTDVLVNKMDIREWPALNDAISEAVASRTAEMAEVGGIAGHYNLDHLRRFHSTLFQDVFDWAGEIRDCEISDDRFLATDAIKESATMTFLRLENEDYLKGLSPEDMFDRLAYYFREMDRMHPFRCGNMTAMTAFLTQMCLRVEYRLDFSKVPEDRISEARDAALDGDLSKLEAVFSECVEKIPRKKKS